MADPHLVPPVVLDRIPLGPLVETGVIDRQVEVVAMPRIIEPDRSAPVRLGRDVQQHLAANPHRAQMHAPVPRLEAGALRLPHHVHQRRPDGVAVAVPILHDAARLDHIEHPGRRGVNLRRQVGVRLAVVQHQRRLDGIRVRVGTPPGHRRILVEKIGGFARHRVDGLHHRLAEARLLRRHVGRVHAVEQVSPAVRMTAGNRPARDDVDVVLPDAVGGAAQREQLVDHADKCGSVFGGLVGAHVGGQHEGLRQPADDLVAVVRQHETRVHRFLRGDVPPVGRQVAGRRQHVQKVVVGNGQHLIEIGLVARLEIQTRENLQQVAVDLRGLRRQPTAPTLVGRIADGVRGDALQTLKPRCVTEKLGERKQTVLHILAGAEKNAVQVRRRVREALSARRHVVGQPAHAGGEPHLLTEDVEHGAVVHGRLGEPRGHHHERIEVGGRVGHHPGAVGRSSAKVAAMGQQARDGVHPLQPRVHDAMTVHEGPRGLLGVTRRQSRGTILRPGPHPRSGTQDTPPSITATIRRAGRLKHGERRKSLRAAMSNRGSRLMVPFRGTRPEGVFSCGGG